MEYLYSFVISVMASVVAYYICNMYLKEKIRKEDIISLANEPV